ncbi:NAD(P)-binding domain-containing protein [Actinoplanes sp. NEAU-A12]|uniref:NAD(P)-binding domain-containing protein n=1 Tax=Actinoplanes sandaracinus TaxID=3045177 RepID=A0ABT6WUJ0_9ACTN|nr:NAD(P)-binding domain-containing protein [Actinoplanes sandaracinus]MDI6103418.1 NAD(P)-binding domain-containing protein [Actinoplanes sandaracinus]
MTVLGLGMMGTALAGAFLDGGHPVTVWNRTPGRAAPLTDRGAVYAGSLAEAVEASPLVVICVRDYRAVRSVLEPAEALLAGRTLVNLTSGTSEEARATAGWAAGIGARYLDGAIMMTPPGIGQPHAAILYGGSRELFDEHEATLARLGGGTTRLSDDHGIPALYDVALLGLMWGTLNSFLHALALVGTEKVEATTFLPFATSWLGGVATFLPDLARQVDEGAYPAHDATLETHLSPIHHLVHESEVRGVDTALPRSFRALAERGVAEGHAKSSYAALIEQFRRPAG